MRIFVHFLVMCLGGTALHCGGDPEEEACKAICECPNQFGDDCQQECAADFSSGSERAAAKGCEADYDAYIECFGDTLACEGETLTHDCRAEEDALAACETG